MDVRLPDGTIIRGVPDGTTKADLAAKLKANGYNIDAAPEKGVIEQAADWAKKDIAAIPGRVGNLAAGAVRGAGSVGATLLYPVDKITDMVKGDRETTLSDLVKKQELGDKYKPKLSRNEERRADMDGALREMGADTDSMRFQVGKLATEIAGTAGTGNLLARGVQALPLAGKGVDATVRALQTGGFRTGANLSAGQNLLTRAGAGAAVGGGSAGLVNPEDAATGAVIGGALPAAAQVAGYAGKGLRNALSGAEGVSDDVRKLAERAKALGITIPADRLVNSRPLNAVASSLNYVPMSGRTATEDAMNSQLNKALSKTFGQDSSNVTMALRKAQSELGGQFDTVLKGNTVNIDQQFMEEVAEAATKATRELGTDGASIIGKQVTDILEKAASGQIDGQAAYNIKKTLDRIGQRNSPEAFYASDLKKVLMGALNRSLGPEQAKAFAKTRQQYGAMLDLEKIAKNGVDGEVSVARLANMRDIHNPEMQELADIAAQFVKPREAAHGSAQRVFGAGGAGLATGLAALGIPGAAAMAVGAGGVMGAGRVANKALNSNALRDLLLKQGVPAEAETLNMLTQGAYRTAPLLSGNR